MQIDVGAATGVGELAGNLGCQLGRLVFGTVALGGDRQSIVAVVGSDLPV
jgi:hypothetical protein